MPLFPRSDGTHIPPRKLGAYRRLHAFLMDKRSQSTVYYAQRIDVTSTLAYLDRVNAECPEGEKKVNLFQIVLCALARTLAERPQLNRFVMGRRFYQRNSITFSFVVKKIKNEKAAVTNAKMDFLPYETLEMIGQRLQHELQVQRGKAKTVNEKEMDGLGYFPRPILSIGIALFKALDRLGLAPSAMLKTDPMYASAYIANLGSVGLPEAPFHHLFDWGTASMFVALGSHHKEQVVLEDGTLAIRPILPVHFSLDNRVVDGLYAARAIQLFIEYLTHPETLERSAEISQEILDELNLKPKKG